MKNAILILTGLGCGLIAGVFFAFSTFVMKALARISAAQGIAAMQSINIVVINPLFMVPFLGTAAACLILAASALLSWDESRSILILAGSMLYVLGTLMVTIVFNVPLNNALAVRDPATASSSAFWEKYVRAWTA
jgi:uncharacterized membrane protein